MPQQGRKREKNIWLEILAALGAAAEATEADPEAAMTKIAAVGAPRDRKSVV